MINDNDEMKQNETKPNYHEASIKLSSYSKDGRKNSDTNDNDNMIVDNNTTK